MESSIFLIVGFFSDCSLFSKKLNVQKLRKGRFEANGIAFMRIHDKDENMQ